ncbi:MAG: tail fiber protein [Wendovervirus sonii]|uniref:Tail fiber protein n=1 Tax=phage Lak_Megaphage_Sonny TaxID=3109229 RepID=A0ABZ0Z4V2_9CAUD|nr:MAG: tail fiber protein [phage Lak_Megaphage_Sonny]
MADIKKIDGYWIKDASARTEIANHNHDTKYVRFDTNAQGLNATQQSNARTNIGAAASNHTHSTSITGGGTSQISLAYGKDYTINAGGTSYVFTTPALGTTQSTAAAGNHNHDTAYAPKSHDHSGVYSPVSHNHDSAYAAKSHTHSYIPLSGSSSITGNLTPSTSNTRDLGSNSLYWNNAYIKTITSSNTVSATNGFIETSDINKKNIIGEIDLNKAYELIDKCSTIIYTLKDDPDQKEQIGTIAQEVQEFFPEIVETAEDGSLMLSYSRLTVILMKVMKDLISRVQKLENK